MLHGVHGNICFLVVLNFSCYLYGGYGGSWWCFSSLDFTGEVYFHLGRNHFVYEWVFWMPFLAVYDFIYDKPIVIAIFSGNTNSFIWEFVAILLWKWLWA